MIYIRSMLHADADGESEFVQSALETKLVIAGPGKLNVAEASNT
jgi:hypothetical protein